MAARILLLALCFLLAVVHSKAASCSSNADCPHDECCGQPLYDVLNIVKSCQPYAQEGQACHGSLLTANCDCAAELECREHTGILSVLHTSKGVCREIGSTENTGLLTSLFGKK